MNLYEKAWDAYNSDFYLQADVRDRKTISTFILNALHHEQNPATAFSGVEVWLTTLPPYIVRDVERAIRGVEGVNRRMNRQLSTVPVKHYVGRSGVSHRKVRA